jgi:glycerol-3-phosphate acyltransferase PlsY
MTKKPLRAFVPSCETKSLDCITPTLVRRLPIAEAKPCATNPPMTRETLLALALGYLLGSIPFGLIVTRLGGKGDIRKIGSGNIGATNVLRTGSKTLAALTLILDCLKAVAAILIARRFLGPETAAVAAAGALVGHLYPVWLKFHGGKGAATLFGALIVLLPIAAAVYAAVWIVLLLTTRISSVAGMAAAVSAPVAAFVLHSSFFPLLLGFALLVLWKHRENVLRLTKGAEPRIGSKT